MIFQDIDLQLLKLINQPTIPILNTFFIFLSYSIYGFLFLLAFYYYRKKEREKFVHLFIVILVGFLFVTALKYLIGRPRPYVDNPGIIHNILYESDTSFPSRHAFIAFALFTFIPQNWKILKYLSIVYLLSIPFAMIYIGVHYPSDILVGMFIGLALPEIISEKISIKILNKVSF